MAKCVLIVALNPNSPTEIQEAWVPHRRKAFLHPAIVETIKGGFFGSHKMVGNKQQVLFTSSLPSLPDEKELTIPLVALAATAVCSVPHVLCSLLT